MGSTRRPRPRAAQASKLPKKDQTARPESQPHQSTREGSWAPVARFGSRLQRRIHGVAKWAWKFPSFLCHHKRLVFEIASFVMTFAGFAYLIYDSVYETAATISSPASDPKNPLLFPYVEFFGHNFSVIGAGGPWACPLYAASKGP